MEFRILKYFTTVVEEKSISRAAEKLFITQPTLSRQLKELEEELGTILFIRGNRRITLTDDGKLFLKHAREILELAERTKNEFYKREDTISGDIYIGGGESYAVSLVAETIKHIQEKFPKIHFHLYSGDAEFVIDKFDKGLLNFAIFMSNSIDDKEYNFIKFPLEDSWKLLIRKEHPLASKEYIEASDLTDLPLIISQQKMGNNILSEWFGKGFKKLNIVATYNLIYNASLLVEAGVGAALTFDKILNLNENGNLCLKPLKPSITSSVYLAWKKNQTLSKATSLFLEEFKKSVL